VSAQIAIVCRVVTRFVEETAHVKLMPEVRREIQTPVVVAAELSSRNRLLPPRWGDIGLSQAEDQVDSWFTSVMRREIRLDPEDVLLARKLGRGARPLAILGLFERLLYRGAVSLVSDSDLSTTRGPEAYETFLRAPVEDEACRYVFKTDISAYYQYIDHERLIDEVVAQTGSDLPVSAATDLLRESNGRAFGLPQLSQPSDVLAEIYIEPMRRDLVRAGLNVVRFADDFRVACKTYEEAMSAWELADQAARELGLVLNERKTTTPKRDRYEKSLSIVRDEERELFQALAVDPLEETPYSWDDDDETDEVDALVSDEDFDEGDLKEGADDGGTGHLVNEAQLTAARRVLERWVEEEEDDDVQDQERAQVTSALLGRALRALTAAKDPVALQAVTAMLVYEPSLTPTVARYMGACAQPHRLRVRMALDDACESGVMTPWQATWIAYVAGELPRRRQMVSDLPHVTWLRKQLKSPYQAVVAESLLALARRRIVSADVVSGAITGLTRVHQPTAYVALGAVGSGSNMLNLAGSDLDRLRIGWGSEHL
jgi:hypothetical protein